MVNNFDEMKKVMTDIYPKELILVPDEGDGLSAPFLDLQLIINDSVISTSIYDKRDAFDFLIVNFQIFHLFAMLEHAPIWKILLLEQPYL